MTSFLTEFRGFTVAIMLSFIFNFSGNAFTVSELQAVKYNGQVFLTWKNPAGTNFQYNVYRSSTPITVVSNLSTANFLGYVRDNSAKNVRKSNLYGSSYYFKITATGAPLATDRGLYVTTCTSSGSFYYAVMVVNLSTGQEDKLVLNGLNSLLLPISESVANPQPVLQYQSVETDGTLRYEYAQWGNNQSSSQYPAFTNAGSYAWNFTVFKSGNSANKSIYMLFKDESPFTTTGLDVCTDCNIIKIDDRLPNGVDTYWSGWNDNYNMYSTNNSVPSSGVVKMYTQARLKETLEWVRKNIGADSNKVYLTGVSHNGFGALLTSQMWPSMVTAVSAKSAPIILKALNSSEREQQWCSSSDNFETDYKDPNTGQNIPIWKLFDIRHMYLVNEMRGGPFISGINGKQDVTVGWVQKYFWYDSVDASRQGGTWYWDQRNHTNDGATFTEEEYTPAFERFTLARSYPAFSFCSVDQNPGNGTPTNGDQLGALNGYLDWNDASIVDNSTSYSITCFVKNMYAGGALLPQQYDSCTTDIAFRRIQKFKPTTGKTIYWNVKNSANKIVQQGSLVYTGDPITLYGIKVYRTNSTISLSYTQSCSTIYYVDADNDGYGSSTDPGTTYCTPPSGVVTNNTDCNDANAAIKPGAQEVCDANDVDEDCDGLKDDADGSVTGKITYYVDADHDNYGSSIAAGIAYCNPPAWYITNHTDCNDANASIKPGAQEICDANDVDEDCDGLADDLDISATGKVIYFVDADHDNFGSSTATGIAYCNPPAWFITNHTDCNDANAAIKPGGQELCDANDADEDCDGLSDDADASVTGKLTYYIDSDHDSYGSSTATGVAYCNPPAWYTTNHTDCNDSKSSVKPNGTEICDVNDVDEDCDGLADDADNSATGKLTYYIDVDHDTYGSSSATGIAYCNPPAWVTTNHTDCNDTDVSVNQSAIDICDGIDNNCNGIIDENAITFSIGSADPLNGCKNDMITLTATGTNMETFKWYKGTNTNPISGQTNSSYSLNYESNTVKAVVTNGFGCTATSNVISLGVLANPTSVITVNNGGNLDLCMGSVNLSTNAVINYARQWYRNDLIVAGATNPDYLPSTDGNYTVMVTNNLGCSKLSAPVTVTDALLYYSDTDKDSYGSAADPGTYSCIPLIGK
ncbi:MAG: putative metal-binding motif-containing protein, partial [Chitinophagales bacterium]